MAGSTIVIYYDYDTDITPFCVFSLCSFQAMMSAVPGQFTVVCRDMEQELNFITGKELTLDVDGQRLYGGFVQQVDKGYFFPADDTTGEVSEVPSRQWTLTGVDYNLLLDTLVLHNPANYTQGIPDVTGSPTDVEIILDWFGEYFDIPGSFDFTDTSLILVNNTFDTDGRFIWPTQGTTMRALLDERLGKPYGSVYWIDANRKFNFLPVQETEAPWGFSDKPNNDPIGVGTPTYGYRDGEFTEDASSVVNDALVWGGSEWAPGLVVFARRENATSIDDHGRWQIGENLVGNANYKVQAEVTARAKIIVDGNASGTFAEGSQGLVNPERQFRCTWFSTDVPQVDDVPVHLLPSQVVPIRLYVFSEDEGVTPFAVDLPLRELSISFPDLDPGGDAYLQFDGSFGVLMDDPMWLWSFLREAATRSPGTTVATTANNDTVDPPYGAQYQGKPSPDPDGIETLFAIPWGYISGTMTLYINGLQQGPDSFDSEDPAGGEFTLTFAPETGDSLFVEATLIG